MGGYVDHLRNPRTTQELRENSEHARSKRKKPYLPTAYDDIHRTCERSWKKYRRTQWRPC
jgi:hypothetical protein